MGKNKKRKAERQKFYCKQERDITCHQYSIFSILDVNNGFGNLPTEADEEAVAAGGNETIDDNDDNDDKY
jgi:hypothetical protein